MTKPTAVVALGPAPKKRVRKQKAWRRNGATLGYIRDGVYWIDRTRGGVRHRVSTGCRTPDAAYAEYERWEKAGPSQYARPGEVREGAGWRDAVLSFLSHKKNIEGRSDKYVDEVAGQLDLWGSYPGFASLDTCTQRDIESFLTELVEGKLTGRLVNERDKDGKVIYERDAEGGLVYKTKPDGTLDVDKEGNPKPKPRKKLVRQEHLSREASRNRYLAALKSLMTWARERQPALTTNTADETVPLGEEDRGTRPPEPVERERWEAAGKHLIERWSCAQVVLLGSGLRWGELARLKVEDIKAGGLIVRKAKRRKGRTVPVSQRTIEAAKELLKLGGAPDDNAGQMDHRLEAACRAAGVKRYTAHHLRHTYGTTCLRNGMDLRTLQERMGHANITTTAKYLHALRAEQGETGFAPL